MTPTGEVFPALGHITLKETLLIPVSRAKIEHNEDIAPLNSACTNDPCNLNVDHETMIKEAAKSGDFLPPYRDLDLIADIEHGVASTR